LDWGEGDARVFFVTAHLVGEACANAVPARGARLGAILTAAFIKIGG
jgi:hypothetical protein